MAMTTAGDATWRERVRVGASARWDRRAALCLALVAVVALSACGQTTTRIGSGTVPGGTATAHARATSTAAVTPSVSAVVPPPNSPFVCANPAGSSLTYAFVNADRQVYMVTGCAAPVRLTHFQWTDTPAIPMPVAWSPSHRYLAVQPNQQQDYCLKILDTSTGAALPTKYGCYNPDSSQSGCLCSFIGWLDDDTFLGRVDAGADPVPDAVRIVRVNIHTQAETLVKSYAWMSDPKLRGGYLFFGGRVNPDDTNAYLYRLSLADGGDTRLVPLGLSGYGGCQAGYGPCSWTAPWDVSPDGTHVLYHNPGADILPSDTQGPHDTPIYDAGVDGSGAVRVLNGLGSQGMLAPAFDPTGALATAFASSGAAPPANPDFVYQALPQGPIARVANMYYAFWRADGQAVVDMKTTYSGNTPLDTATLHVFASQTSVPLAANTYFYLWAN